MANKREFVEKLIARSGAKPEEKMAPSQNKITAADLVSHNKSPEVRAIYDRALKHAYEDQQALLKKAKALKTTK